MRGPADRWSMRSIYMPAGRQAGRHPRGYAGHRKNGSGALTLSPHRFDRALEGPQLRWGSPMRPREMGVGGPSPAPGGPGDSRPEGGTRGEGRSANVRAGRRGGRRVPRPPEGRAVEPPTVGWGDRGGHNSHGER